jgi:hypothetical protein
MLSALFSGRKPTPTPPPQVAEAALPVIERADVAVGHVFVCGESIVIDGTLLTGHELLVSTNGDEPRQPERVSYFKLAAVLNSNADTAIAGKGFVAVLPLIAGQFTLSSDGAGGPSPAAVETSKLAQWVHENLSSFLDAHADRLGFLFAALWSSTDFVQALAEKLPNPPASYLTANGHIEQARGVPGIGGIVIGWSICMLPAKLFHWRIRHR